MAAMELSYPEWYEKSGAFKPEIMAYMSKKEPDGLGGELTKVIESLRVKENVQFMQRCVCDYME